LSKRLPNVFEDSKEIEADFYRTRKREKYKSIQSCCGMCVLLMVGIVILINLNWFISAVIPYLPNLNLGSALGLLLLFGIIWLAMKYILFKGVNRRSDS
jgi:hypothetical protein